MKFKELYEISDIEDSGIKGKDFERIFIKALKLVGLDFEENSVSGPGWDIRPKGKGWIKLLDNADVNIKVFSTKRLFNIAELSTLIPWTGKTPPEKVKKLEKKIKRLFNKRNVNDIVFLKPKSIEIQNRIIKAVENEDVDALNAMMTKKNFLAEKLGKNYNIRINTLDDRITTIVVEKGGKAFMRSEKPRQTGYSPVVAFKSYKPEISKIKRKVKEG